MGVPVGVGLEIEWVPYSGVWTDVTADLALQQTVSVKYGRTSEFSDVAAAVGTWTLDNPLGKYSPGLQLLTDGVTAHPYWPNVLPRRRCRFFYTVGGVRKYRFFGYNKGISPVPDQGDGLPKVPIVANCRLDQMSRITVQPAFLQAIMSDQPFAIWTNTDPAGSTYSIDPYSGGRLVPVPGVDGAAVWGANSPVRPGVSEGLTALTLTAGSTSGQATMPASAVPVSARTSWTVEWWAGMTGPGVPLLSTIVGLNVQSPRGGTSVSFSDHKNGGSSGLFVSDSANPGGISNTSGVGTGSDGLMHHYAVTGVDNGTNLILNAFIDGALDCVAFGASGGDGLHGPLVAPAGGLLTVNLNASSELTNGAANVFGPIALYGTALPTARIAAHAALGLGSSQTTGWRIGEYLHWGGVADSDMSLAAGQELVASHPTAGKSITQCCLEMVTTEGGGAACYTDPGGLSVFLDRTFRKPDAPVMTFDAEADLDGGDFLPSLDELNLVTRSTVQRNGGNAMTFIDTAAEAGYGQTSDSNPTSYATTDQAALYLAQERVRSQSTPKLRLVSVTVDLLTAQTNGLDGILALVKIGSRIRVTNLARGVTPTNSIDLIVEGWTETVGADVHTVKFDCSPADQPPRFVLDNATYGRLNPPPSAPFTVNTALPATAAPATVKVNFSLGPGFTLTPAMYPFNIVIGSEVLTLPGPPSGSTSPQTFTGVLRGQLNTQPAAQAAGSVVKLYPAPTATL